MLELDPDATWRSLESCLDITSIDDDAIQEVLIDFEVGRFDEATFVNKLESLSNREVSYQEIITAWNAMLGPLPRQRLEMLKSLRGSYKIHLLSNTNETHIRYVYDYLKRTYDIDDFGGEYFDSHHYSHMMKMRKPNRDIYKSVVDHILYTETSTSPLQTSYWRSLLSSSCSAVDAALLLCLR